VRIDQIPDEIKQLALSQVELKAADEQDKKLPRETVTQHKFKVEVIKEATERITSLLRDGQALTVRLDLDRKTNDLTANVTLTGKPGTKLSASIAECGKMTSLFAAALGSDPAMKGLVHFVLPDHLRTALEPVIDEAIRSAAEHEKDAGKRAMVEKLLAALTPTFKSGDLDGGFSLRGPGKNGHYGLVVAVKVKDGLEIDKTLHDLVALIPESDRAKIKLDAESAGAVKIHRVDVQKDLDARGKELFGENPMYLALRADAAYLGFGEDGLEALKDALSAKPAGGPQLQFAMALKQFAKAMAQDNKDAVKLADEAFGQGSDNDRVRLTLDGGKALQVRLSLKAPVLKFLAQLGASRDRAASQ
jgi:hypothetical protein